MNISKLEQAFAEKSEVEVVRLLTCNFDEATFSSIKHLMSKELASALTHAIKFKTHLSMTSTSVEEFLDKIRGLLASTSELFSGSASKICGYSGKLLENSKTLMGKPDELVSPNEHSYVLKLYPWPIKPVNSSFTEFVDQYIDKVAFFCLPTFDVSGLANKEDVAMVSDKYIVLKNKTKIPVVVVS